MGFSTEKKRREAIRLYNRGWTHEQISEELGLSRSRVTQLINEVVDQWQSENIDELDRFRMIEVNHCNELQKTAYDAFEASKVYYVKEKDPDTGMMKAVKKTDGPGNPKFLPVIERCIRTRATLLKLFDTKIFQEGADNGLLESLVEAMK